MQPVRPLMLDADAFFDWAARQPEGRFELSDGEIVAMPPERLAHTRVKVDVVIALRTAVARAGLGCEAIGDGVSVRIGDRTVYEPDATVRCGPKAPGEDVEISDPVVVVEVVSPSSRGLDTGVKLLNYFRLGSVTHYLVVHPEARTVIHYSRNDTGDVLTRILGDGTLSLDPPGLHVGVAEFFASL